MMMMKILTMMITMMLMMKLSHILSGCGSPQKNFGILSEMIFRKIIFSNNCGDDDDLGDKVNILFC